MEGVIVVDHPLVQHKLTLIRDKSRSTKSFRELLSEIGMLICYEVTRDLPLTKVEVETPLATMMSPRIAGKKLVFAPILRAGLTGRQVTVIRANYLSVYTTFMFDAAVLGLTEQLHRGRYEWMGNITPPRLPTPAARPSSWPRAPITAPRR